MDEIGLVTKAPTLREHRRRRGLTQTQLAVRAGFSERLIRKAEAGEAVRPHTLEVLAEALSTADEPVSVADLRGDPLAVVQAYYRIRRQYGYDFAVHCQHLFGEGYTVTVHGDRRVLPYAGTWEGVEGLHELYQQTKHYFRPWGETVRFFTSTGRVMAVREGRAQRIRDNEGRLLEPPSPPRETRILQEWLIAAGKIVKEDIYFDSHVFAARASDAIEDVVVESGESEM